MANTDDYRYSEQVTRLRRAQELIAQASAEMDAAQAYELRHCTTGVDEYVDVRIVVQNAHACVRGFAASVQALADMESQ